MREDLHVPTGSYVLDAISDTEREEFERHLQHCPACEAEVRGMRETAARLALACAVTPPARMEQQVLAATYRTRQLPPLSADRPRRALPRRRVRPRRASSRSAFPRSTVTRRVAVLAAAASVAVVSASGMASLPPSRVYQVWVMSPSGARSAGLMHGSSLLASAIRPGDRIGITVEPADGTARPTTTPVAVLPV